MRKRIYGRRILHLFLICLVILVIPSYNLASASSINEKEVKIIEEEQVQPRGFIRKYRVYVNPGYSVVMSDSNWYGETTVTVALNNTEGPSRVSVRVKDTNGNSTENKIITTGTAATFSIPAGNFTVYAASVQSGYVTLGISLS